MASWCFGFDDAMFKSDLTATAISSSIVCLADSDCHREYSRSLHDWFSNGHISLGMESNGALGDVLQFLTP